MKALQWMVKVTVLLLILAPHSWERMAEDTARESRGHAAYQSKQFQNAVSDVKRHAEGTFTSDFTRYLDKIKAKDFVHWLIRTKSQSVQRRFVQGTTNSAVSRWVSSCQGTMQCPSGTGNHTSQGLTGTDF